jgi:hypothetical protein
LTREEKNRRDKSSILITTHDFSELEYKVANVVSEKMLRFQGENNDLTQLSQQIVTQLEMDGYKAQSGTGPAGMVIHVQKAGMLRGHYCSR